jgi:hypothetical protein
MMNANLFNTIKRIVAEQGEAILANPQRLKGLVSDYAKNEPKSERLAFGRCIEYGFYGELKKAASENDRARLKAAFARKLHAEQGIEGRLCVGTLDLLETLIWGPDSPEPVQPKTPPTRPVQTAPIPLEDDDDDDEEDDYEDEDDEDDEARPPSNTVILQGMVKKTKGPSFGFSQESGRLTLYEDRLQWDGKTYLEIELRDVENAVCTDKLMQQVLEVTTNEGAAYYFWRDADTFTSRFMSVWNTGSVAASQAADSLALRFEVWQREIERRLL